MSLLDRSLKVHDARSVALVLAAFDRAKRRGLIAPGIDDDASRTVLAMQIIESIRRVQFVRGLVGGNISPSRASPSSNLFDPIRAAAYLMTQSEIEEAAWLVFLSTHFGQRPETGWNLLRAFYAGDSDGPWTWLRASNNIEALLAWLHANTAVLRSAGRFGNHRKYESLDAYSGRGTGATLVSYINWVKGQGSHGELFRRATSQAAHDPGVAFSAIYEDMSCVERFGRTARFDYLCMLGKLGIAGIWPQSMYVVNATGPKRGGKLLFGQNKTSKEIEEAVALLDSEMHVGMQVFEDALCNWQKSPDQFVKFRG